MLSNIFRFVFSKAFWINTVLAVFLLFVLIKWLLGYLDNYTLHGESVTVPDFIGTKIEKLDEMVLGKEVQYIIIDSVHLVNKPRGTVVEQDPPPGSQVKKDRKIYLTVNAKMPLGVAVPDLTDVTLRQATAILESYGFKVGNKKFIPDQCFNCVLAMEINGEKISSGAMAEKGTTIDLILGKGQSTELVAIPDLYGKTFGETEGMLSSFALNPLAVSFEDCKTKDDSASARVYRQSPVYEKDVAINLGSTISIWLTCNKNKIKISE